MGSRIFYRLTNDEPHDECVFCLRGECVQKVECCDQWGTELVLHGSREDFS
jgi:hypothetical protein